MLNVSFKIMYLLKQGKSKPYTTIERADFSNAIVFDNLIQIGNY